MRHIQVSVKKSPRAIFWPFAFPGARSKVSKGTYSAKRGQAVMAPVPMPAGNIPMIAEIAAQQSSKTMMYEHTKVLLFDIWVS